MRSLYLALAPPILAGCAFGDGEPFGEVTGSLSARYELAADRDQGDGWQKLSNELEVHIDAMTVDVDRLELVDSGSAEGLTFDPASPPPGYTLCHNGHCHRDDGALIPYEEVEAALSGGAAPTTHVVLSLGGGELELTEAEALALSCDGACVLGKGFVALVRVHARGLAIQGAVRDGLAEPRFAGEVPIAGSLALGEGEETSLALDARVELPLDQDHGSRITLGAALVVTAKLFDDLPLVDLAAAGAIDPADAAAELRAAFGEQRVVVDIQREEP